MVKKRILLHAFMAVMFCLWLMIPHYVTTNLVYVLLAGISIFAVVFYSKTKMWWTTGEKRRKKTQPAEMAAAALLFLCCIPTGIASIVKWDPAGKIATVMATVLLGLSMHIYANQQTEDTNRLGADLCLYGSLIAAAIPVLGAIYHLTLGLYPVTRMAALCVSLGVCMLAYISAQGPHRNIKYQAGWAAGCMLAVALTFTVNQSAGTHAPEPHSYTVLQRSSEQAECVLDNGRSFAYDHCPTPQNCTDRIYLYDGWFHVAYLLPAAP